MLFKGREACVVLPSTGVAAPALSSQQSSVRRFLNKAPWHSKQVPGWPLHGALMCLIGLMALQGFTLHYIITPRCMNDGLPLGSPTHQRVHFWLFAACPLAPRNRSGFCFRSPKRLTSDAHSIISGDLVKTKQPDEGAH